jgi:two-component system, chemotaxis family, protein-glutamate methylesterase/glutaminase
MPAPERIVVADDSSFMRSLLSSTLTRAGFDVVATAADGDEALAQCERHRPDAMTLDLAMPGRDGIGVLKQLQAQSSPLPVIVVSAFSPAHGARAVDALAEGAVDLVAKPAAGLAGVPAFASELSEKLRVAIGSRRDRRGVRRLGPTRIERRPAHVARPAGAGRLVVIACSTGGPKALGELVPRLPARLGAGTLIVQHMPPGFTGSLAERLDRASALVVREARDGDRPAPDTALIAPGGKHLRLDHDGALRVSETEPIGGLRPRADLTIDDVARAWGERCLLVVLTGMGKDGLDGARELRRRGGRVLAEDESTCTVYGMPRAVAEAELTDAVLPLDELAAAIAREAA